MQLKNRSAKIKIQKRRGKNTIKKMGHKFKYKNGGKKCNLKIMAQN